MLMARDHEMHISAPTTHDWLIELARLLNRSDDVNVAYAALRAVLHALRRQLNRRDAVALGAQLPLPIHGIYFQGWHPDENSPHEWQPAFLECVRSALRNDLDPDLVVRSVFGLLKSQCSVQETAQWMNAIPLEVRADWLVQVPSRVKSGGFCRTAGLQADASS